MESEIVKPISMRIDEFKTAIVNEINNCEIPIFTLDMILKEIYAEVHALNVSQSAEEKKKYEESLIEK